MNYNLFILTFVLVCSASSSAADTKMKVRILPPDEGSLQSTRQLLGRFKDIINNEIYIKDSPLLQQIKKDTIKTSIETLPLTRVTIPIQCNPINGCDNSEILNELSELLELDKYRLRVRVIRK